uniref:Uncharacterized protein LOC113796608 n=1 Tax=Dermatophagoides pteronyssinus TaxID=6956 RepID=A0A6P6YBG3_DERPT|nr:uncharacterized protein LOC113796608 [Dermatophagoides pteronyssinus]
MYSKILFLNLIGALLMIMAIHCDIPDPMEGFKPVDLNDTTAKNALEKALKNVEQQMNENINSTHLYRVKDIEHAHSKQNIAYKVVFLFGETKCKKTDIDHIDSCEFITGQNKDCGADIRQMSHDSWGLAEFICLQK